MICRDPSILSSPFLSYCCILLNLDVCVGFSLDRFSFSTLFFAHSKQNPTLDFSVKEPREEP